jgi:hypothetical protein
MEEGGLGEGMDMPGAWGDGGGEGWAGKRMGGWGLEGLGKRWGGEGGREGKCEEQLRGRVVQPISALLLSLS